MDPRGYPIATHGACMVVGVDSFGRNWLRDFLKDREVVAMDTARRVCLR
jgi:hypothetical protein